MRAEKGKGKRRTAILAALALLMGALQGGGMATEAAPSSGGGTIVVSGSQTRSISGGTISGTDGPAVRVKAGAVLNLQVSGDNTLIGGPGYAAVCVEPGAVLVISGSGTLNAVGGDGDGEEGSYGGGAGIGGNGQHEEETAGSRDVDFGTVVIDQSFTGIIRATGGREGGGRLYGGGAGIGGGGFNMELKESANKNRRYWGLTEGRIDIHGGTVYAESAGNGAGIGGGGSRGNETAESDISITITGGTIEAVGGRSGAGIGGGSLCDGGSIRISGGTVHAKGGLADGSSGGAGIGGGDNASVEDIQITGGSVTAEAEGGAAGIGGGAYTSYSEVHWGDQNGDRRHLGRIAISGAGTIVRSSGGTYAGSYGVYSGAGIGSGNPSGSGNRSVAFDISITEGAFVEAYGADHAQAIGYGCNSGYTGYGIRLYLDDTIQLWAENADYDQPALAARTVHEAVPVEYRSGSGIYLVSCTGQEASPGEAAGTLDSRSDETRAFAKSDVTDRTPGGSWATLYNAGGGGGAGAAGSDTVPLPAAPAADMTAQNLPVSRPTVQIISAAVAAEPQEVGEQPIEESVTAGDVTINAPVEIPNEDIPLAAFDSGHRCCFLHLLLILLALTAELLYMSDIKKHQKKMFNLRGEIADFDRTRR